MHENWSEETRKDHIKELKQIRKTKKLLLSLGVKINYRECCMSMLEIFYNDESLGNFCESILMKK